MIESLNDGLRRFADFKGRSNRQQYVSFLLFYVLVDLFLALVSPNATTLNEIVMALLFVPLIAVEIRRSHDVGRSGWWILVPFYSLYLMFAKTKLDQPENPDDQNSL